MATYPGPKLPKPTVKQGPMPPTQGSPPILSGAGGTQANVPPPIPHGGPMPPVPGTGFQNPNLAADGSRAFRAWPTNPRASGHPPMGGPPSGPPMAGRPGDPRAINARGMIPPGGFPRQGGPGSYGGGGVMLPQDIGPGSANERARIALGMPLQNGGAFGPRNGRQPVPIGPDGRPQWEGDWDPRAPWDRGPVQHGDGRNQQTGQPLTGATGQSGYPDWFEQGIQQYGMNPAQAAEAWAQTGQAPPQNVGQWGFDRNTGNMNIHPNMSMTNGNPGVQGPPMSSGGPTPYNPAGNAGSGGGSYGPPQRSTDDPNWNRAPQGPPQGQMPGQRPPIQGQPQGGGQGGGGHFRPWQQYGISRQDFRQMDPQMRQGLRNGDWRSMPMPGSPLDPAMTPHGNTPHMPPGGIQQWIDSMGNPGGSAFLPQQGSPFYGGFQFQP